MVTVADPGLPVGECQPSMWALSMGMYAKTIELGPVGGIQVARSSG